MAERYLARCRLPGPQQSLDCPVLLAAGALLEDTQENRLVVQLKFRSLSTKTVSQLYVAVRCGDGEPTIFHCYRMAVGPGQSFGQYTALELPFSDAREFRAEVRRVEFSDGSHWNLTAAQRRQAELEAARRDETERREAERQKAVQEAEARAAARKAAAAEKAMRRQEGKLEATATTPPRPAPGASKKSGKKIWFALGGAAVAAIVAVFLLGPGLMGDGDSSADGNKISTAAPGPAGGAGGEPVGAAGGGLSGGVGDPGPAEASNQNPIGSDGAEVERLRPEPGQNTVPVYLQEDGNGVCMVDPDVVKEAFPESDTCNFFGVPAMSRELEPYLMDSFPFAWLVREGTHTRFGYDYSIVTPRNEPESNFCLLVFQNDGGPCLTGYFVGTLADEEDGRWRMDVTPCRYEFSQLVDTQRDAFYADRTFLYENYIPPEEVASSGAAYYLRGYNTGRSPDPQEDDCQMYHIWSEFTSPHLMRFVKPIDNLVNVVPSEGRWVCCLLMDKNYEPLGYTMLTR